MTQNTNSRRNFIKLTAAGAAGSAISWDAASYARVLGSNDRISVGVLGFSERAMEALIPAFNAITSSQNCEIVAVADIWNRRRDEGADFIGKLTGKPIAKARNNDELYEMKNVQAVIIATADHQHATHGVQAVRAGRDAYIEKPLANTMADARAILKAVKETNRVVQIGTQRRSAQNTLRAKEYLQSGAFGEVTMVEMCTNANQPRRWRRPQLVAALRQEDTDWKRFLAGRTRDAFDAQKYFEYRLYWPYSSGIPDQWMVHQIDALHFITGLPHPRSVVAQGGIYSWRDGRINPDTVTAVFDYGPFDNPAKGFQAIYSSRMHNSAGGNRDLYYSINGVFNASLGKVSPEGGLTERYAKNGYKPTTLTEKTLTSERGSTELAAPNTKADATVVAHMRNWIECVRNRQQPVANIEAGYNHSVALCMTIAAMHSGKRATFDDAKQEVTLA
ncbi:MAG: Inositol 2-dehydrogenase/D-chiro-inositol 3-dehydrogenase [Acidobacteria bacterium]|nr:Inositol 2-dehydrogenase/D-chiro-inositol 3-dehydrogenase [Acidobacteriota bacterium]